MKNPREKMRKYQLKNKEGQVTIFVIIAVLIVAIMAFLFYPKIKEIIIPPAPQELMPKECIQEAVSEGLNLTMMRGGKLRPELYFRYKNFTLNYLCYTSEWYKTCVMQEPMLKQRIENEVLRAASSKLNACIKQMEEKIISQGYTIKSSSPGNAMFQIIPGMWIVDFNITMNLERGEEKISLPTSVFRTTSKSNAYDIIMIASSIQNWEARYGDSTPESYMGFYPTIKVEKLKQEDGTKVYIITDRETRETLQFATRSLAWPPGIDFA